MYEYIYIYMKYIYCSYIYQKIYIYIYMIIHRGIVMGLFGCVLGSVHATLMFAIYFGGSVTVMFYLMSRRGIIPHDL